MDTPVTLPYAREPRYWTRRRVVALAITLVLTGALTTAGHFGHREFQRRLSLLNKNAYVGPVDWGTVFSSWTMMKTAWHLSSSVKNKLTLFMPPRLTDVCLLGLDKAHRIDLRPSLHYSNGKLHLTFDVRNGAAVPMLVPSFRLAYSSASVNLSAAVIAADAGWLARGARIVQPGATTVVDVCIPMGEKPRPLLVQINLSLGAFMRSPGFLVLGEYVNHVPPFAAWEDLPQSAIERVEGRPSVESRRWDVIYAGLRKTLAAPVSWPDGMLTPDERRPKPWQRDPRR